MSRFQKVFCSSTGSRGGRSQKPAAPLTRWLQCEQLEDRTVPDGTPAYLPPSYFFVDASNPRDPAESPLAIARHYLGTHTAQFGLTSADVANAIVTDRYTESDTGITHIYLRQSVNGLEVENANIGLAVASDGRVLTAGGGFVAGLSSRVPTGPLVPTLSAVQAVQKAADALGISRVQTIDLVSSPTGVSSLSAISAPGVSLDDITARLHYVPTADGAAALSWQLIIRTTDRAHWYDLSIADADGVLISQNDWIEDASYNAIAIPNESPQDGGFTVLSNPQDATASPFGWHDTNGVAGAEFTDTRGNNVDVHLDVDGNDVPDGVRPNGGAALDFSTFAFNPAAAPSTTQNRNSAQVNLFYTINIAHDLQYHYGFTEAAGNFQSNNYGNGGAANDAVQGDAQDGSGTNNANFGTPPDGSAPRMQQFIWTLTGPNRDSDLDNSVIFHEFGHGVSNRLTGGPSNSNALGALQSGGMGEGWSDFYALMFLQRPTDTQNAGYGIGTYLLGQAQTGTGIRDYPYSYNMAVDPMTFDQYGTSGSTGYGRPRDTEVHASGQLWTSALWDLNWLLINKYGYDSNLYTGWSAGGGPASAGNKLALRLVNEGLTLQPANPSFLDARDAVLAADIALNGGLDQAEIWAAFARRGLGLLASTPGANSPTLNIDFSVPAVVSLATPSLTLNEGNSGTTAYSYTVNLAAASLNTVTVGYATSDGTATTSDNDYYAAAGTLTFTPGQTTKTITVYVAGDTKYESDEAFSLTLSSPTNGYLVGLTTATGTIRNDDVPPTMSVSNPTVLEGNAGTRNLSFIVSLSNASALPIAVTYSTSDGTATTADSDYIAASGTFTFAPGSLSRAVNVVINGDVKLETNEYLTLAVSSSAGTVNGTGTIANDDAEPPVAVSNASVAEGNSGSAFLNFTVSLQTVSALPVTVDYLTLDGTAISTSDYVAAAGSLTFMAGETSKVVSIEVRGDRQFEFDESMRLRVIGTLNTVTGVGTILNDDRRPFLTATGSAAGVVAQVLALDENLQTRFAINPFDQFMGGVSVATGDVNGDFTPDIIIGAGPGAGSRISVYDGATGNLIRSYYAFGPDFFGGVNVAAGDVDGDGLADIIVGSGPGAGPHVKVFSGRTGAELLSFFAFATGFRGGVTVAAGDLDGDGRAEIVVGMGFGGTPDVALFNGTNGAEVGHFYAYDLTFTGGVNVALGDLDGDGRLDIIAGTGAGSAPHVKAFRGTDGAQIASFFAYDRTFQGGVSVSAGDLDGDGIAEILTGSGVGAGPHFKAFNGLKGLLLRSFFAGDPYTQGGLHV